MITFDRLWVIREQVREKRHAKQRRAELVCTVARTLTCPRCKRSGSCASRAGHVYGRGFRHAERDELADVVVGMVEGEL